MTTLPKAIAALIAATACITLTACSNNTDGDATNNAPGSSSTSSPTTGTPTDTDSEAPGGGTGDTPSETDPTLEPDPNTGEYDYCRDQKPFTGEAADEFGADQVLDAYCTMVALEMEQSFLEDHLRGDGDDLKVQDFSGWTDYMTVDAARDFNAKVTKALAADNKEDKYGVWSLTFFDAASGSGYSFTDEPAALNRTFTPAETEVDTINGEQRLILTFEVSADLNVVNDKDGKNYFIPIARRIAFSLAQNPVPTNDQNAWLIDGWNGNFTVGDPVPRPALPGEEEPRQAG